MRRTALFAATIFAVASRPAAPDTSGRQGAALLGEWTFDKGDARDSSGNGLRGTPSPSIVFKEGCAVFDGKGRIEIPIRAADIRRGYRTVDIEIRALLDRPDAYYSSLFSHPLFTIAVNSLGTGRGRPCFAFAGIVSDLAPEKDGDARWGKAPPLDPKSTDAFYYWGWVGQGSVVIPPATWVTLRFLYDGKSVRQFLDGRLVATHAVRNPGVLIAREAAGADDKAVIGRYFGEIGAQTELSGRIDYVRVRATR
jgi:hypothetical protein